MAPSPSGEPGRNLTTEFRNCLVGIEVNSSATEAEIAFVDGSRLRFCHRVDDRWAKSEGDAQSPDPASQAAQFLARLAYFRLNRRHLELRFDDSSQWEARFQA